MKLLGIDFGTCYIKCFDVEKDALRSLDTLVGGESSDRLANVITYKEDQKPVVGEPNFWNKKRNDVIVSNIKSKLVKAHWCIELPDGTNKNSYEVVKDIMEFLIDKLVTDSPNEKEYCAVITTPVNFSKRQNEIIRQAALAAGFSVHDVVSEPFASLFYLMKDDMDDKHNVLIIDIGGGTLDMCLSKIDVNGTVSVVTESTNGINFGGNTIDEAIIRYLMEREKELHDALTTNEQRENEFNKLMLLNEIKEWKHKIYNEDYDEEDDKRTILYSPYKGSPISIDLSAKEVKKVLEQSGIKDKIHYMLDDLFDNSESLVVDDVTDIFMIGGTTMIPYFEECVKAYFKDELGDSEDIDDLFERNNDLDLEEKTVGSVASGAGLYNLYCQKNTIRIDNNIPTQIYTKSKYGDVIAKCNLEQTKYTGYTPNYGLVSAVSVGDHDDISVFQMITVDVDGNTSQTEEVFIGTIYVNEQIKNECECFCLKSDLCGGIYAEFGNYEGKKEESRFTPLFTSNLVFCL